MIYPPRRRKPWTLTGIRPTIEGGKLHWKPERRKDNVKSLREVILKRQPPLRDSR